MKEIILYTTDDCPYCNIAERVLKDVIEEYSGLFEDKNIKLTKFLQKGINAIPTILVGSKKIEGLPEKEQIHTALFE